MKSKKKVSFLLIIIIILLILHLTGMLTKVISYSFENYGKYLHLQFETEAQKREKELKYNNDMVEINNKISSYFNYLQQGVNCSNEIKDYNDIVLEDNKGLNLEYKNIEMPYDNVDNIIKCNVFNSTIKNLYINIPYVYIKINYKTDKINEFIKKYSEKGYNIYLIYYFSNDDLSSMGKDIFKTINKDGVKGLNFYYNMVNKSSNIYYIYQKLRKLEDNYLEEYPGLDTNIGIYSNDNIQNFKKIKESTNFPSKSGKYFLIFRDNYFSIIDKNTNISNQIINELRGAIELMKKDEMLLVHFDLLKENVEKIDWSTIYTFAKEKNIKLSIPNSIMYSENEKQEDEKTFKEKMYKSYPDIDKREIEVIFLKNKLEYVEKNKGK